MTTINLTPTQKMQLKDLLWSGGSKLAECRDGSSLKALERKGLATSEWDTEWAPLGGVGRFKRRYTLTPDGREIATRLTEQP